MARRELGAIAIAAALHVALLGAARSVPLSNLLLERLPRPPQPIELVEIDSDEAPVPAPVAAMPPPLEQEAPPRDEDPPARDDERRDAAEPRARVAAVDRPAARDDEPNDVAPSSPAAAAASPAAAALEPNTGAAPGAPLAEGEYSPVEIGGPAMSLGAFGLSPFGTSAIAANVAAENAAGAAAPTEAPRAKEVAPDIAKKVVSSTLLAKDRDIGIDLPATQVVVGVVAEVTRATPVPHNTRATFSVDIAPGGKVSAVRVTSASAGEATVWASAAKLAQTRLAAKGLDLGTASSTGATILVSVTVKHVFPTGSSKGAQIKPTCANQILNDIAEQMDDGKGKPVEPTIPLFQDENGRPCIPVGISGTADEANIGATKQIQVQTSSKVLIQGQAGLPAKLPAINKDPIWLDRGKEGPRPLMPYKARKYKRDREKKK